MALFRHVNAADLTPVRLDPGIGRGAESGLS